MRQRTRNDASGSKFRFIAAIGASAVVTAGALAATTSSTIQRAMLDELLRVTTQTSRLRR
jgi:hypothetical protein